MTGGGGCQSGAGGASLLAWLPARVVDGMVVVLGRIVAGGVQGSVEATGRSDTWVKGKPFLQLIFCEHLLCARNCSRYAGTEGNENRAGEPRAPILAGESGKKNPKNIETNNFDKNFQNQNKSKLGEGRMEGATSEERLGKETVGQNDTRREQSGYQGEEHSRPREPQGQRP